MLELIQVSTGMASPYKSLQVCVKHFFGYLVYEIFLLPESWRGSLYMYLLSFPRFWTLSIERFSFWFSSILNGVTLKTSNRHVRVSIMEVKRVSPFPTYPGPLNQNEVKCPAFDLKMFFHSHANKTHFHKKGFSKSFILHSNILYSTAYVSDFGPGVEIHTATVDWGNRFCYIVRRPLVF